MDKTNEFHISVAQQNLTHVTTLINFADTKAATFLTISLAIFGLSLTDIPAATRVLKACFASSQYLAAAGIILSHIAFYGALAIALWKFIQVVRPTIAPKSEKHSWFFFQSMAQLSAVDYHEFTTTVNGENLFDQLNDQIYNNSVVAKQKFESIKSGVFWLIVAITLILVAFAPVLVFDTLLPKSTSAT